MDATSCVDDPALIRYFADLRAATAATTPLSSAQEVELSARIQLGDLAARDELVRANLRFVIGIAKKYEHRGLSLGERISAGNLGLITAAERFDGTKGFKFISYAVWWIRQSIVRTIAEQGRMVRLPLNRLNLLADIHKTSMRLSQGRSGTPKVAAITADLGLPVEEVERTLDSARGVSSLDEPVSGTDLDRTRLDLLADASQESPDANLLRESVTHELDRVLNSLDDRELLIVRLYFGLDGHQKVTLDQIGSRLGLTRERVRQLKERALAKLRHPSRCRTLQDLVGELRAGQ